MHTQAQINTEKSKNILSVVIATFNGAKTLPDLFNCLQNQIYDKNKFSIEVIGVDAGSEDETLKILIANNAVVIENQMRHAEYGKHLGLSVANGNIILFLDQDEVLMNPMSLQTKFDLLQNKKTISVLSSGYFETEKISHANFYGSVFGDPISASFYKQPNQFPRHKLSKKKFSKFEHHQHYLVSKNTKLNILGEIACNGNALNYENLIKYDSSLCQDHLKFAHSFISILKIDKGIVILKNDPVKHNSSANWRILKNKIKWRALNNFINAEGSGIRGRTPRLLFFYKMGKIVLINLSIVGVLYESAYLVIHTKRIAAIHHIWLSPYAFILSTKYFFFHKFRKNLTLERYGN
jgi:glycosyltransferase involved in cell wall biosynthesis